MADVQPTASSFDFDEWMDAHGLTSIKHLLIQHDLNVKQNLHTNSPQFVHFLSDPELFQFHAHLIPIALKAIQQVPVGETHIEDDKHPGGQSKYVVITETEENILKALQSNADELYSKEMYVADLAETYQQSVVDLIQRKNASMEATRNEINSFFKTLQQTVAQKQSALLDELEKSGNKHEQTVYEQKESQIASECVALIRQARDALTDTLNKGQQIIHTSMKMNIDERKQQLVNLNNTAMQQFLSVNRLLKQKFSLLQNAVNCSKCNEFGVLFDAKKAERIQRNIADFQLSDGVATKPFEGVETEFEGDAELVHKRETIVSWQAEEIKILRAEIKRQRSENHQLTQRILSDQKKYQKINAEVAKARKSSSDSNSKGAHYRPKIKQQALEIQKLPIESKAPKQAVQSEKKKKIKAEELMPFVFNSANHRKMLAEVQASLLKLVRKAGAHGLLLSQLGNHVHLKFPAFHRSDFLPGGTFADFISFCPGLVVRRKPQGQHIVVALDLI